MSNVRGRIAVDVQFTDSTSLTGVQSLKTITLQDATEYTTGKVAIFTDTISSPSAVGYVALNFPMSPSYRDSTGGEVDIQSVSRIAFISSRDCKVVPFSGSADSLRSRGSVAVSDWPSNQLQFEIQPLFTAGSASYTLVVYGS